METQVNKVGPQSGKFPQGIVWIAGIALTLFCAVGIAAMMGWIPNSMGGPGDTAAVQLQSANTPAPVGAKALAPQAATAKAHTPKEATAKANTPRAATARPTAVEPARTAPVIVAAATCAECGVIESVREITSKGAGSGLGAVGGGVVGGLLGNQVGGGRGQDVMTVVGVVGGAVAGNEVEKRVKASKSYEVTVRMNDGSSRLISEASLPAWRIGEKVKLVNGAIRSNA